METRKNTTDVFDLASCSRSGRFLLAALAMLSCVNAAAGNTDPARPNVIIFYYDDMGYSDYGANDTTQASLTPNLDTLAAEGMRFTAGHSADAVCTPSRYALLTGRYAWRTRLKEGVLRGYAPPLIDEQRFTIGKMFQNLGYHTSMVGKWHLGMQFHNPQGEPIDSVSEAGALGDDIDSTDDDQIDFSRPVARTPNTNGFDYFLGTNTAAGPPYLWIENQTPLFRGGMVVDNEVDFSRSRPARNSDLQSGTPVGAVTSVRRGAYDPNYVLSDYMQVGAQKVVDILADRAADDQPFFIYVAFPAPHKPWAVQSEFRGSAPYLYGDYLVQTDHYSGVILDALADPDGDPATNDSLVDNTVVFMSSDNGPEGAAQDSSLRVGRDSNGPFRGHKRDSWEGGTRVPFVIRWPCRVSAGVVTSQAVWQGDFLSTMAEFLEYDLLPGEAPDAESFLSVLQGYSMPRDRREGFVQHSIHGQHSIIDKDGVWKLIDGTGGGGNNRTYDFADNSVTSATGIIRGEPRQLFNLSTDPEERFNLLRSPNQFALDKQAELYALLNNIRGNADTGTDGDSNVPTSDKDGDGIPDFYEQAYRGLNASRRRDANADPDNDNLTNLEEYRNGTNPRNPDTDGDSQIDGLEVLNGSNPRDLPTTVAHYNALVGRDGNFNNSAFASLDTDSLTRATRLAQGGSLSGGGAGSRVYSRSHLAASASGPPTYNLGSVHMSDQATAHAAGDYFSFTVDARGSSVRYDRLSFYSNQFGMSARIDVSYTRNGTETFVMRDHVPSPSNGDMSYVLVDFPDMIDSGTTTWTFYLYGASASEHGTRLDDIKLQGYPQ